jgi:spermidine synthase
MRLRPALLLPLFFLSGAAGLGCQMVWMRMFAAGLGHEVPALLGVTSAFLGGMAVGAWFLDRRTSRSRRPAKWYGGLELLIGLWVMLSALFIPAVNRLALEVTGPAPSSLLQWLVVFALPLITLLPATAAMGATLPAMDSFLSPLIRDGRGVGALYAANTFGAVAGTLGSVFVLMPQYGFRGSLFALAALNLFCGAVALASELAVATDARPLSTKDVAQARSSKHARADGFDLAMPSWRSGLTIFLTGLLGMSFELVGIRVLSQVLENTIYTYASVLAAWLVFTALGAALYQRFGLQKPVRPTLTLLLCSIAVGCLVATYLMGMSGLIYDASRKVLGDALASVLISETVTASAIFALPTVAMGATFSHLVQSGRVESGGVGRAGALNTLGCGLAGVIVGLSLLPALGAKWTAVGIALGYLALLPAVRGREWFGVALPLALVFGLPGKLEIVDLPPGARVREYREGVMAAVAVVETSDQHRALRVNNRLQMGGTAAAMAERRQAHIPLLLHSRPERALFLGPGTGITLGASAVYPGLVVDGVELVPEVRALMSHFEPENGGPFPKPGLNVLVADARRYVRTTTNRYDVIVADLFHPAQDGAGFLYTREHFEAVRHCLRPGALFCQWLPLHQLDELSLRLILRTFSQVFAETHAFLLHFNVDVPALALVGTPEPLQLPGGWFERRTSAPAVREALRGVGLDRSINLAGCLVAGPEALRRYAGEAPLSTDNYPAVIFAAPRFSVRRDTQPHRLLLTLLERCEAEPEQFVRRVSGGADEAFSRNLRDFIAARNIYLKGLVEEGAGQLAPAIEAYLESARRSLQFTAGYARCVNIIRVMAGADRDEARRLFQRLEEAQPAQPLGRQLLGPLLDGDSPK